MSVVAERSCQIEAGTVGAGAGSCGDQYSMTRSRIASSWTFGV
jgi:hypothetical protein